MQPAPFRARALAGGLGLDADLPPPGDTVTTLCGLHALRHVERYLDSLGLAVVLHSNGDDALADRLTDDYDPDIAERELRRHRRVSSRSGLRRVLRDDVRAVPLLHLEGSDCLGWRNISWEGMRLDHLLQPGRLFLMLHFVARQAPRPTPPVDLHLFAWQPPFPSHSLVTWTNGARLCDGPQEIDLHFRKSAAFILQRPEPIQRTVHGGWGAVEGWWQRTTTPSPS